MNNEDKYRYALEQIAYHERQDDERAEAMREIARSALGWGTPGSGVAYNLDWRARLIDRHVAAEGTDVEP